MKHLYNTINPQANIKAWSGNTHHHPVPRYSKVCLLLAKWCWCYFGTFNRSILEHYHTDEWSCFTSWQCLTSYGSSDHWNDLKIEIWVPPPPCTTQLSPHLVTVFSNCSGKWCKHGFTHNQKPLQTVSGSSWTEIMRGEAIGLHQRIVVYLFLCTFCRTKKITNCHYV